MDKKLANWTGYVILQNKITKEYVYKKSIVKLTTTSEINDAKIFITMLQITNFIESYHKIELSDFDIIPINVEITIEKL